MWWWAFGRFSISSVRLATENVELQREGAKPLEWQPAIRYDSHACPVFRTRESDECAPAEWLYGEVDGHRNEPAQTYSDPLCFRALVCSLGRGQRKPRAAHDS